MTAPLMEVSDLAVHFRAHGGVARAVDGVALRLASRGEILGVVGESGCGKSTLARTMLGLAAAGGRRAWPATANAVDGQGGAARAAPAASR